MQKGQVAIESLILVLVIMSSTIYLSSLYYQTHNSTLAIGITRNTLVEQANSLEDLIIIESVKFNATTNTIVATINSEKYTTIDFDIEQIKEKIINNTDFEEIEIEIISS